eukprot:5125632-Prymnesium_polylepis.1
MRDASMRPPAKPTLRHADSSMAALAQWNHTPGSRKSGLPPQISKNSGRPMVGSRRYLPTSGNQRQSAAISGNQRHSAEARRG